jgi:hypothetical protein
MNLAPSFILTEQNREENIDRLAAQRQLYSDAKWWLGQQVRLLPVWTFVMAIIAVYFSTMKVYALVYGILAALLHTFLMEAKKKDLCQQAAIIQERFDCEVLVIKWPASKIKEEPMREMRIAAADRYKREHPDYLKEGSNDKLTDWYSTAIGDLPAEAFPLARLICQRSNLAYDAETRTRYKNHLIKRLVTFTLVIFIIVTVIGIIWKQDLGQITLAALAPLAPVWIWGVREYRKHVEAIESIKRWHSQAENLYQKAIQSNEFLGQIAEDSRQLQDEIFERRKNNPLIPDKYYHELRSENEKLMNKSVAEMVAEVKQKAAWLRSKDQVNAIVIHPSLPLNAEDRK